MVQRLGPVRIRFVMVRRQGYDRPQCGLDEPTAVARPQPQRAGGVIVVVDYHDAVRRRHVQVAQHVALRQSRDDELFRVPAVGIAAKSAIA